MSDPDNAKEYAAKDTLTNWFSKIDRDLNKIGADATYVVADYASDFDLEYDNQAYILFNVTADPSLESKVQRVLDKYNLLVDSGNDPNDNDGKFDFGVTANKGTDIATIYNTSEYIDRTVDPTTAIDPDAYTVAFGGVSTSDGTYVNGKIVDDFLLTAIHRPDGTFNVSLFDIDV